MHEQIIGFNPYEYAGFTGWLDSAADIERAADYAAEGHAMAVNNYYVYAIWGRGESERFRQAVDMAKGREPGRPYAMTIPFTRFVPYICFDKINPELHSVFENPTELARRLGALAFLRVPGRERLVEDEIPPRLWSRDKHGNLILQNYDTIGKDDINYFTQISHEKGVEFMAVTSLNPSGTAELVVAETALPFIRNRKLPLLQDRRPRPISCGSYPILAADEIGLSIPREGPCQLSKDILQAIMHDCGIIREPESMVRNKFVQPQAEASATAADPTEKGGDLADKLRESFGWTTKTARAL